MTNEHMTPDDVATELVAFLREHDVPPKAALYGCLSVAVQIGIGAAIPRKRFFADVRRIWDVCAKPRKVKG